jgi:hypothetical protein
MMSRFLIAFLAVCIGISLLWQIVPLGGSQARLGKIPLEGKGFYGKEIPLTEKEAIAFQGIALVKRKYKLPKGDVFLIVLDGQNNRHLVHDPRYCFEGMGWTIVKEAPIVIPGTDENGIASLFLIRKEGNERQALAWYSDGKNQFASPWEYWWKTSLRRLTLGKSGEEPVLILLQSEGADFGNTSEIFDELPFLKNL